MPAIGDHAPTFALPDTDGVMHEPGEAPATVVVFTCQSLPYALAWHERIVEVARDYAERGVRVLAINPNDAERYPRDSPEAMHAGSSAASSETSLTCATSRRTSPARMTQRRRLTCSCSMPRRCSATAARPMPTTTTPGRTPPFCAGRLRLYSPAVSPTPSRHRRSAARSSGSPEESFPVRADRIPRRVGCTTA